MKKGFAPILILVLIAVIAVGGYFLVKQNVIQIGTPVPTARPFAYASPTPIQASSSLPTVQPGFKQYVNKDLGYGFNYPDNLTINPCSDGPCLGIPSAGIAVETLGSYYFSRTDVKNSLLDKDLYCSAGGPGGTITCKNNKIEDFTDSLGFIGYKVSRTRTFSGQISTFPPGDYPDTAYVFLFPQIINGPASVDKLASNDYSAILFSVSDPTLSTSIPTLNIIANNFFLIKNP